LTGEKDAPIMGNKPGPRVPSRGLNEGGGNMLGSTEILIIAAVVLVLFGSAAIPRFARSLGKAKKEFEEGVKEASHPTTQKEEPEKPKEKKEEA
jgi:sec-independent protein translocase protein TatA